jgi:hypothetical protein
MNPKTELLERLSAALTRGQGGFTEEDLALAYAEVVNLLTQGQLGNLVIEGELDLTIRDGTVLYSRADGDASAEPLPLEMLIKNMPDTG